MSGADQDGEDAPPAGVCTPWSTLIHQATIAPQVTSSPWREVDQAGGAEDRATGRPSMMAMIEAEAQAVEEQLGEPVGRVVVVARSRSPTTMLRTRDCGRARCDDSPPSRGRPRRRPSESRSRVAVYWPSPGSDDDGLAPRRRSRPRRRPRRRRSVTDDHGPGHRLVVVAIRGALAVDDACTRDLPLGRRCGSWAPTRRCRGPASDSAAERAARPGGDGYDGPAPRWPDDTASACCGAVTPGRRGRRRRAPRRAGATMPV